MVRKQGAKRDAEEEPLKDKERVVEVPVEDLGPSAAGSDSPTRLRAPAGSVTHWQHEEMDLGEDEDYLESWLDDQEIKEDDQGESGVPLW